MKKAYDYVEKRMSRYQTVVTAAIANRDLIDGLEVRVQTPDYSEQEKAYLKMTAQNNYEQMEQVWQRLMELLHYQKNRLAYRKRLVVVHEQQDLSDEPRFLLTDALHWESGRVIQTWSYRWSVEIFHEFTKQITGLEAAQVRFGGSGETPFSLKLRSAVVTSESSLSREEI